MFNFRDMKLDLMPRAGFFLFGVSLLFLLIIVFWQQPSSRGNMDLYSPLPLPARQQFAATLQETEEPVEAQPPAGAVSAVLLEVYEGNILLVRAGSIPYFVRYLGLAPPDSSSLDAAARRASKFILEGETIFLDTGTDEVDEKNRLLRYIWLADGRLVNEELVRLGCAKVLTPTSDTQYQKRLLAAQADAAAAKRSCFQDRHSHGTSDFREWMTVRPAVPTISLPLNGPVGASYHIHDEKWGEVWIASFLRSGPGTVYAILDDAWRGRRLRLVGCESPACKWYQVPNGSWIDAASIKVDFKPRASPTPAFLAQSPTPTPAHTWGVVTADLLNIRRQPSLDTEPLATLRLGACVDIVSVEPEWVQIRLTPMQTAWCSREYVAFVESCPTPTPESAQSGECGPIALLHPNATVKGDTYLHECFGEGDGGLRKVKGGTPVELLGVGPFQPPVGQTDYLGSGPFFKIRLWDGQTAWLPAHSVDVNPNAYPQLSGDCEPCDRLK